MIKCTSPLETEEFVFCCVDSLVCMRCYVKSWRWYCSSPSRKLHVTWLPESLWLFLCLSQRVYFLSLFSSLFFFFKNRKNITADSCLPQASLHFIKIVCPSTYSNRSRENRGNDQDIRLEALTGFPIRFERNLF